MNAQWKTGAFRSRDGSIRRPDSLVLEKPSSAAASPSCPGCLFLIAIGWMICPGNLPPRRHDLCLFKKPRSRPLAGSILSAKDLWPRADSIRSASGRRVRSHPALPTSPRGFWGRCEPRRAEGALARGLLRPRGVLLVMIPLSRHQTVHRIATLRDAERTAGLPDERRGNPAFSRPLRRRGGSPAASDEMRASCARKEAQRPGTGVPRRAPIRHAASWCTADVEVAG